MPTNYTELVIWDFQERYEIPLVVWDILRYYEYLELNYGTVDVQQQIAAVIGRGNGPGSNRHCFLWTAARLKGIVQERLAENPVVNAETAIIADCAFLMYELYILGEMAPF